MQGPSRKIVQAILYEVIGVAFVSPAISLAYDESLSYSGALAVIISLIAMSWNMLFNALFERWEARRRDPERTFWRRVLHSLGFEGGLVLLLIPLMAWWLSIGWLEALVADIGLFAFFFFYSFAFQWGFDRVFGLPDATCRGA